MGWLADKRRKSARDIVQSPSSGPQELRKALRIADKHLRAAIAAHKNTDVDLLVELADDSEGYWGWNDYGWYSDGARICVARRADAPVKALKILAADRVAEIRAAVAAHTSATAEMLATLASDSEKSVVAAAAINIKTDPDTLARLAESDDAAVRLGVAGNLATPPTTLARLASDGDRAVRMAVAANSATPQGALARLSEVEDFANVIARNPSAAAETLDMLARRTAPPNWVGSLRYSLQVAVATNPGCGPETLRTLASSTHEEVVLAVIANPSTPLASLHALHKSETTSPRAMRAIEASGRVGGAR